MITETNWGYNCLTTGVHHGRPEAIWNLPLSQAILMYGRDNLKQLVIARIRNDGMQYVAIESKSQELIDKLVSLAEERFEDLLTAKIQEILDYYASSSHRSNCEMIIDLVQRDKLNKHFQPLHDHDSINLLCRILAQSSEWNARKELHG